MVPEPERDPEGLVESARAALGPALVARHTDGAVLRVIMIDPMLEQSMLEGLRPSEQGSQIVLDAHRIEQVLGSVRDAVRSVEDQGLSAVLVCAPQLRPAVHRMVADLMEKGASGSLWGREPAGGAFREIASGLAFPYGLHVEGESIFVSESWRHRLLRFERSSGSR